MSITDKHTGFTPGPWIVNEEDGLIYCGGNRKQYCIAVFRANSDVVPSWPSNQAHAKANAELISSAPTLLAERDSANQELQSLKTEIKEFLVVAEQEVGDLREWKEASIRFADKVKAERDSLKAENQELRKRREDLNGALRFKVEELEKSEASNKALREALDKQNILLKELSEFVATYTSTMQHSAYNWIFNHIKEMNAALSQENPTKES